MALEAPNCTNGLPITSKPQYGTQPLQKVFGKKPTINTNGPEPKLKVLKKIPSRSTPSIKIIMEEQPSKEAKCFKKNAIPLIKRFTEDDKEWVINPNCSKLQTKNKALK